MKLTQSQLEKLKTIFAEHQWKTYRAKKSFWNYDRVTRFPKDVDTKLHTNIKDTSQSIIWVILKPQFLQRIADACIANNRIGRSGWPLTVDINHIAEEDYYYGYRVSYVIESVTREYYSTYLKEDIIKIFEQTESQFSRQLRHLGFLQNVDNNNNEIIANNSITIKNYNNSNRCEIKNNRCKLHIIAEDNNLAKAQLADLLGQFDEYTYELLYKEFSTFIKCKYGKIRKVYAWEHIRRSGKGWSIPTYAISSKPEITKAWKEHLKEKYSFTFESEHQWTRITDGLFTMQLQNGDKVRLDFPQHKLQIKNAELLINNDTLNFQTLDKFLTLLNTVLL